MPPVSLARQLFRPLAQAGFGAGFGAYGATTADPKKGQSPWTRGVGYGLAGGLIGPAALKTLSRRVAGLPPRMRLTDLDEFGQYLPRGIQREVRHPETVAEKISNWTYFSMLSSPDTIARANLGATGGVIMRGLETALEGALSGDISKIKGVGKALKGIISGGSKANPEGWRAWSQGVFADEKDFRKLYMKVMDANPEDVSYAHMGGRGLGRLFSAPDLAAVQALKHMGLSAPEAHRYTLAGEPTSALGRSILGKIREMRGGTSSEQLMAVQSAPFARVGLLGIEKGLQRIPGVGEIAHNIAKRQRKELLEAAEAGIEGFTGTRDAKGVLTGGSYKRIDIPEGAGERVALKAQGREAYERAQEMLGKGKSEEQWERYWRNLNQFVSHEKGIPKLSTPLQRGIQQGLGGAAGVAAYHAPDVQDPRLGLVGATATGPGFLPYQLGRQTRKRVERQGMPEGAGEWAKTGAVAAGGAFQEFSPLGFQPLGLWQNPWTEVPRRVIPSGIADVARAVDPAYGREGGEIRIRDLMRRFGEGEGVSAVSAPWRARLPGLREELPETFAPVDVFGRPRFERPVPLAPKGETGEAGKVWKGFMRTAAPSLSAAEPPAQNLRDPQMGALARMGVEMQAPSAQVNIPGLGVPLRQTKESAASVQRVRGLSRQLAANIILQIPGLQEMPDSPMKRLLVDKLVNTLQGSFSRTINKAVLPLSILQGAQLPAFLARSRMETTE